jgi:hypothetical protein
VTLSVVQKVLIVVGVFCGVVAVAVALFANGNTDTAVAFAGGGVVAEGLAFLL